MVVAASVQPGVSRAFLTELSRRLTDEGKLIEAGFASLRATAMHEDSPPNQVHEMRLAFFAGAQHLFGSMMTVMDEDAEPTEQDMRRMANIAKELEGFIDDYKARFLQTEGNA